MISRTNKFPTRLEFLSFREHARQSSSAHFRVFISPHHISRLSVIIPKKVNKRASVRNQIKRLVYDCIWPRLQGSKLDCVVLFKPFYLGKGEVVKKIITSELTNLHV